MREIVKVHEDVLTAHAAIKKLMEEYAQQGYTIRKITMIDFKLVFPDGWVHIYWEKGCIYQEIIEEKTA